MLHEKSHRRPLCLPHDTEQEQTSDRKVSDLNEQQLDRLRIIAHQVKPKGSYSEFTGKYYHKIMRCLDRVLRSRDKKTAFPLKSQWAEGTAPPDDPDEALTQAITAMRTQFDGMQRKTRLKHYTTISGLA